MAYSAKKNDPRAKTTDAEFIRLVETKGPAETARITKTDISCVYQRRSTLERLYQRQITSPQGRGGRRTRNNIAHPHRIQLDVINGVVLIGSDAHIWPGPMSTAMRAFVKFCKEMSPSAVILNGDVMDLPKISRHAPIGWEAQPNVQSEIEAAQDQLGLIERATFKAHKIWTLGNHDARFETRLATIAPEYAKVAGVHLRDHFGAWSPAWSVFINDSVVVKHRFKSGIHAPHNNTMWSGRTMVTGHLHSAKVMPLTDYNGTRYGVDTGCLADTEAKAFVDYTEDNPKNWRAGFAVLTFKDGELLPPELVSVWDTNRVVFRGSLIEVGHETPAQEAPVRKGPARKNPSRGRMGRRLRHRAGR